MREVTTSEMARHKIPEHKRRAILKELNPSEEENNMTDDAPVTQQIVEEAELLVSDAQLLGFEMEVDKLE